MGFDQLSDFYCLSSECLVCLKMFTQFRVLPLPLTPTPQHTTLLLYKAGHFLVGGGEKVKLLM